MGPGIDLWKPQRKFELLIYLRDYVARYTNDDNNIIITHLEILINFTSFCIIVHKKICIQPLKICYTCASILIYIAME